MPRLFIAVPLPAEVKLLLASLRSDLPGARWVPPEQAHLTLQFLGDIDDALVVPLVTAVTRLSTSSFSLTTGGLGVFPSRHQPRVLWLGLAASAPLLRLHAELTRVISVSGLSREERPFHPHLTLARLKETPLPAVIQLLNQQTRLQPVTFMVDRVIVYTSILGPGGVRHLPQATVLLADAPQHIDQEFTA